MKNLSLKIILLLAGLFTLQSCLLDDEVVDFGKGPVVVQFPSASASKNFLKDNNNTVYDYKIPIQYFGGSNEPLAQDVTVVIGVSPTSTAKEGVEFSIPNKTITIPAGSNVGELLVKVNSANLDASNPKQMILEISSASQTVSSNKKITKVTLQAICPSKLEGDYIYANGSKSAVTVKSVGTGLYEVSKDNAFKADYPFTVSDVCGKITVTGGYLTDNHGIAVSGTGSVDNTTGTITINYTVDGYFANRQMILVKK